MRYFTQDKEYIGQEYDQDTQTIVETQENKINFHYEITQAEESHLEVEKEYPNGSKDMKVVIDKPEKGEWQYSSKQDFAGDDVAEPPADWPHEQDMDLVEQVTIIRDLTQEEIEQRQREQEEQEQEAQRQQERAEHLNDYIKDGDGEITLNVDVPNAATAGGPFLKVDGNKVSASAPSEKPADDEVATVGYVLSMIQKELKK